MKTKFLFKLLATTSVLMTTLVFSNITVFAEDAPPQLPFADEEDDSAPPVLEKKTDEEPPPVLELKTGNTTDQTGTGGSSGSGSGGSGSGGSSSGGSGSGGSGGSPILLNKKTKTPTKTVTDLDKDGDIDTADEILFQQQEEQGITETGPEIVYVLLLGLILNGMYFRFSKNN